MQKLTVWKDKNGLTIHIGDEWDYQITELVVYDDSGMECFTDDGEPMTTTEALNPLPDGAYKTEEAGEFVDGYWVNQQELWKALRREAYGPIEEQMDYMAKYGADALAQRNLAIKSKYPKPKGI